MENSYKSYHGVMMEEIEAKAEAKMRHQVKLEIAENLVGKLALPEIAQATGLPLSVIEELRGNPS